MVISSILGFILIYMVGQCRKSFWLYNFEWIIGASQFNEDFMKNYNEECVRGYFF